MTEWGYITTSPAIIAAKIERENIAHYSSIPLDVLLENHSKREILSHDRWVAEQKLEEVYYRRGVSY